jgi:hypothetical protein
MSIGTIIAPLTPQVPTLRAPPPRPTAKRATDDESIIGASQNAGRVTATNRVEPGGGGNPPVAVSGSSHKRRRGRSPLYRLVLLLAKTYRQPGRLPTDQQAAELERLRVEAEQLLEARRNNPNWREEQEWS